MLVLATWITACGSDHPSPQATHERFFRLMIEATPSQGDGMLEAAYEMLSPASQAALTRQAEEIARALPKAPKVEPWTLLVPQGPAHGVEVRKRTIVTESPGRIVLEVAYSGGTSEVVLVRESPDAPWKIALDAAEGAE